MNQVVNKKLAEGMLGTQRTVAVAFGGDETDDETDMRAEQDLRSLDAGTDGAECVGTFRDGNAMRRNFKNAGYLEGLEEGKEGTLQEGFDAGYLEGVQYGYSRGHIRGAISALSVLQQKTYSISKAIPEDVLRDVLFSVNQDAFTVPNTLEQKKQIDARESSLWQNLIEAIKLPEIQHQLSVSLTDTKQADREDGVINGEERKTSSVA